MQTLDLQRSSLHQGLYDKNSKFSSPSSPFQTCTPIGRAQAELWIGVEVADGIAIERWGESDPGFVNVRRGQERPFQESCRRGGLYKIILKTLREAPVIVFFLHKLEINFYGLAELRCDENFIAGNAGCPARMEEIADFRIKSVSSYHEVQAYQ